MAGMGNAYNMGPRIPIRRRLAMEPEEVKVERGWNFLPSRVVGRSSADSSSCVDSTSSNTCEKPANLNVTSQITVGVLVPVAVVFVCVLFYFHRRNMKRQAAEDSIEAHKSLDFGVETGMAGNKPKRQSKLGFGGEKPKKTRGLSLDMNLSSPYLLPETVHGSRESMHSLAKTLHQQDDPYRPIATYASDTVSVGSFEKTGKYTPSMITTTTKRMSRQSYAYPKSPGQQPVPTPLRQNSYPKSPLTPSASSSVTAVESTGSDVPAATKEPTVPEHGPMSIPEIQQPPPVAQRGVTPQPAEMPSMPKFSNHGSNESVDDVAMVAAANGGIGLGLLNGAQVSEVPSPATNSQVNAVPPHQSVTAFIEDTDDYADYLAAAESDDEGRGRGRVRESGLMPGAQKGNRLSVGFRPLPEEGVEGEDPETRANRIRSFYKEYFDDSAAKRETQFGGAAAAGGAPGRAGGAGNYNGDGAYFDPELNQFIMPYAQPVSRRAMTPPPSGSRFPGPRGPGPRGPGPMGPRGPGPMGPGPRGPGRSHAGSLSGMSMPRAGSAMSFGPRPDSSASARGPRSGSAMSGKPRKPMPPPAALSTLPTPSKLTEDFALINASDFAPPESIAARAAGRSQSPLGERRPYAPKLPAASPLLSTADEMPALPSPHMMRKSATFTGLEFAPPRKFKDPENMSDAGSIKSNRSGVSQAANYAMRSGAGRVSRLPEAADALKPTWTIGGVDTKKG